MLTQAILAKYILSVAQLVAAHCEKDRLSALHREAVIYENISDVPGAAWGDGKPVVIVVSNLPRPSKAWADAWAEAMLKAPLYAGDEKREIAFGLTWAAKESSYKDGAVGDGGKSACSFQVSTFWGHSADELTKSPALCVSMARGFMARSFALDAAHPMKMYAGGDNTAARKLSDARMKLVDIITGLLPPIEPPAS